MPLPAPPKPKLSMKLCCCCHNVAYTTFGSDGSMRTSLPLCYRPINWNDNPAPSVDRKMPRSAFGPLRVAKGRHEEPVRIAGVDDDQRNQLRVAKPEVRPRPTGVRRPVDAVANREVGPAETRASHVNNVRIRRRDRHRADRAGRLIVEERRPRRPESVARHTPPLSPDVEDVRLARPATRQAPARGRPVTANIAQCGASDQSGCSPETTRPQSERTRAAQAAAEGSARHSGRDRPPRGFHRPDRSSPCRDG